MANLYAVLGLSHRATSAEIKAAYWALAKQSHPDVNAWHEDAEDRIREINAAYDILGEPELRAAYDLSLAEHRAGARRAFWRAAGLGATTSMLAVSCVWAVLVSRQSAPLQPTPSRLPLATAGPEVQEHAELRFSEPGHAAGPGAPADGAGEPKIPSLADRQTADQPEPELSPGWEAPPKALAAHTPAPDPVDEAAPPDGPAPPPPPVSGVPIGEVELVAAAPAGEPRIPPHADRQIRDQPESEPSAGWEASPKALAVRTPPFSPANEAAAPDAPATTPAPVSGVPIGEVELVAAAPREGSAQGDKIAYAPPPEESRQMPAPTDEQGADHTPAQRNADPRTDRVAPVHARSGRQSDTSKPTDTKRMSAQREPGVVARSAAALRWPNADEPFINLGGKNR